MLSRFEALTNQHVEYPRVEVGADIDHKEYGVGQLSNRFRETRFSETPDACHLAMAELLLASDVATSTSVFGRTAVLALVAFVILPAMTKRIRIQIITRCRFHFGVSKKDQIAVKCRILSRMKDGKPSTSINRRVRMSDLYLKIFL